MISQSNFLSILVILRSRIFSNLTKFAKLSQVITKYFQLQKLPIVGLYLDISWLLIQLLNYFHIVCKFETLKFPHNHDSSISAKPSKSKSQLVYQIISLNILQTITFQISSVGTGVNGLWMLIFQWTIVNRF